MFAFGKIKCIKYQFRKETLCMY